MGARNSLVAFFGRFMYLNELLHCNYIMCLFEQGHSVEQNVSFSSNYFGLHSCQAPRTLGLVCSTFSTFYFYS